MHKVCFIDTEVSESDKRVCDYGAVMEGRAGIHTHSRREFYDYISAADYLCGHNIVEHDLKYTEVPAGTRVIDTLYLSPLLFPNRPYHALVKDDKILSDEMNNPFNDAEKAGALYYDEVEAFMFLDDELKSIFYLLLHTDPHFSGFFDLMGYHTDEDAEKLIFARFEGRICTNADVSRIVREMPVELAYALAIISATKMHSVSPGWVVRNYPRTHNVIKLLRNGSCGRCRYCRSSLDPVNALRRYFGYEEFRRYEGEPLQEDAVRAAVSGRSLLAVFPTGGGKSLTFQVPALMAGEAEKALTVVISPLQSLMKDQVDNLERKGIVEAVTINGLLDPVERAKSLELVRDGTASLLYISPESLRSNTIEKILVSRQINRFVIDEAHCFSAWGQDFRVDYLYIGEFIRKLQEKKGDGLAIPVSCFTATAKQKVISDIREYFRQTLGMHMEVFASRASRTNLRYEVLYIEDDEKKYATLRMLIESRNCPTIVYVSRTKKTVELAERLCEDGFSACAFNGRMESFEKQINQEDFIYDRVQVIVATSAFGMGVDKPNVKLVVHYDISESLENYVQEAGRAGRDPALQAECYVLFNNNDLNKHFMLLNQTKMSINEIQQIWTAIKELTRNRPVIQCSALELAREAGWNAETREIETRVRTAVQALENAGYIARGNNSPRVFADAIMAGSLKEARGRIEASPLFEEESIKTAAIRIIQKLIGERSRSATGNVDAESRIDYLADILGYEKAFVIEAVQRLRDAELLSDAKDISAYILASETENRSKLILKRFRELELFLLGFFEERNDRSCLNGLNYKYLNDAAVRSGVKKSTVKDIITILNYWMIRNYVRREQNKFEDRLEVVPVDSFENIRKKRERCYEAAEFIVEYLYGRRCQNSGENEARYVEFSVKELVEEYNSGHLIPADRECTEEALHFLSKIGALKLEGGFLVIYNPMQIVRKKKDNRERYKKDDYKLLDEHYKLKIQQIHIVGEFANMMVRDYGAALMFVDDYFHMEYREFLKKYFTADRLAELSKNITPEKYRELFETLSPTQRRIIDDDQTKRIVIAAGPGSGKTMVLVHKLASLLLMEDVKHEQLLMLTFSRSAAIEFKKRLKSLIGNAANYVEIKTFHSYCFDIIGKIGNIDEAENVVKNAREMIENGEADPGRITKSVLVIDEAQDMDENEYLLVETLIKHNSDLRIIAVGDDDQNIYSFRGSDSKYLRDLGAREDSVQYILADNYRSCPEIVKFTNRFVKLIRNRMKTVDIAPVTEEKGEVRLYKNTEENAASMLTDDLVVSSSEGSTCVLTATNEEALIVLGRLIKRGRKAKLIQSMDEFDLYDLVELRYFIKTLEKDAPSPVIGEERWKKALEKLKERYAGSACLEAVLELLNTFYEQYESRYMADLKIYIHESRLEDHCKKENGVIMVSTMHKAKGREFDNVYMLIKKANFSDDSELRKMYVGMTRAKKSLHIHYCGDSFDRFAKAADSFEKDLRFTDEPDEVILQLTHKDVYLNKFGSEYIQKQLAKMLSGDHLEVEKDRLSYRDSEGNVSLVFFSKAFLAKKAAQEEKGYEAYDAVIRFICGWKGSESERETAIVLPDIYFRRKDQQEEGG